MVDSVLRGIFNSSLKSFFEPLPEGAVEVSLSKGLVVRGLKVNPTGVNEQLQINDVDLRVEEGKVGQMQLGYIPRSGAVSVQVSDIDVRVRPHTAKLMGRCIMNGINDLMSKASESPVCRPREYPRPPVVYYPGPHGELVEWEGGNPLACCSGATAFRTTHCFGLHSRPGRCKRSLPARPVVSAPEVSAAKNIAPGRRPRLKAKRECCRTVPGCQQFDPNCPDCLEEECNFQPTQPMRLGFCPDLRSDIACPRPPDCHTLREPEFCASDPSRRIDVYPPGYFCQEMMGRRHELQHY